MIAAGGGGIPTAYQAGEQRKLAGIECVIDKDFATELLARELDADVFIMLTDAAAVYVDWGKPTQKAIRRASPTALTAMQFAAGSMGPKVEAILGFLQRGGRRGLITSPECLPRALDGDGGTHFVGRI